MKKFTIEVSLKDASKAQDLFFNERGLSENLDHTYTNVWESQECEDIDPDFSEEYTTERMEEWLDEIKGALDAAGIEYEVVTE